MHWQCTTSIMSTIEIVTSQHCLASSLETNKHQNLKWLRWSVAQEEWLIPGESNKPLENRPELMSRFVSTECLMITRTIRISALDKFPAQILQGWFERKPIDHNWYQKYNTVYLNVEISIYYNNNYFCVLDNNWMEENLLLGHYLQFPYVLYLEFSCFTILKLMNVENL